MYNLEILPVARQDLIDIVQYIRKTLKNPVAANRLAEKLTKAMDSIPDFPYANQSYIPIRPLKYEYRRLVVENYLIFYRVDEKKKLITVSRVVYGKRDYGSSLE